MEQLRLFDLDTIDLMYDRDVYAESGWPAPFRCSKELYSHCCNPECGLPLRESPHIWFWRGKVYCSQECAKTLQWPDPVAQEAFSHRLAELRAQRQEYQIQT